jgi:hypothetical protein
VSYVALILEAMAAQAGRSDLRLPASVANRWALALCDLYRSWPARDQEEILAALRDYRDLSDGTDREDATAALRLLGR